MDVNPRKLQWTFKVYVMHLWEVSNKFNKNEINSMEMLLQDMKASSVCFQGDRIQVSILKSLMKKWRGNILEFNMYVMSNFIVVDKKEKIRTTMNRWSINFSQRTTVIPVSHPNVISEVVGKEDPRELITSKGKETKRLAVLIKDLENNSIGCVLFGDMIDQILSYLKKEKGQAFDSYSALRINTDLEEVRVFRDRRLSGKPANSARIIQVSSHGLRSGAEELIRRGDAIIKIIEEVLNSTQASTTCTRSYF
ncbi:hypothetical protein Ahy_A09g042406 [Arachis hypogaea]|uniref:Replication protein A 70 kDa DNA-binding subunit B/D first OB fold domain-containing protein n=1 Tax=Arachis hypogaea TaxID=3818 RepID=A0A445BFT0_ARAHY|nr:hypothetical protein Ahy_A09g042406 [Arachis hypogaea]